MTPVVIVLIIVGVIFIVGSFMVSDKLTPKEIEHISKLSEDELKVIVERHLKKANQSLEDALDEKMENKCDEAERSMEKLSNEKIMAISDYSDTVLESMNKTHNEIMFLYSMLGDKHTELTNFANQLQDFSGQMKKTESEALQKLAEAAEELEQRVYNTEPIVAEEQALQAAVSSEQDNAKDNHNQDILLLHRSGKSDVDIAKELGLGLGEVKLVIGLFKEEEESAV